MAGDEVILRGASEKGLGKEGEAEEDTEVNRDDDNGNHS